MTVHQPRLEVFTDGACLGNPGPGGWAALLRWGKVEKLLSGAELETTNNRMELMAAIAALEALTRPSSPRIITDSQYVKRGIQEWLARWRNNGWRTANRQPVKNQDLWQRLETACRPHQLEWQWVRGHAGHVENERVDIAARQAAESLRAQA